MYTITIHGRGGHGSRPDNAVNPLDCFAAIHTALRAQGYRPLRVDGGTSGNIIPNSVGVTCEFSGDGETLRRVVEHTCNLYGCTYTID